MREYVKVNTMFKREGIGRKGPAPIIEGDWATPEIGYLAGAEWAFTEKVNGTNTRVSYTTTSGTPVLDYGGRTNDAQISTHMIRKLDALFRTPEGMARLADVFPGSGGVVLYGEGCGDKINRQGAMSYHPGADFVLFDVEAESDEGWLWLRREDVEDIGRRLGLLVAPIVGYGTLYDAATIVKYGLRSTWGQFTAEGIVARPVVEMKTRRGERIITKIKTRDFAADPAMATRPAA